MIKNKRILVVGAGGFIGGHLAKRLLDDGNSIVAADIKPKEYIFFKVTLIPFGISTSPGLK